MTRARRRSLALLAALVAGFGLAAAGARLESRSPALSLALLALLFALFRLAGRFEARADVPDKAIEPGNPGANSAP